MSNRNEQKKAAKKITTKQAQKLLEKQAAERVTAVNLGIKELLQKHSCSIDLQMTLSSSRGVTGSRLVIIPQAERSED
jgi:flagella basal body P-ring formation protein FlgA